jgi:phage pi2 protein 07
MKILIYTATLVLLLASGVMAKRTAPEEVPAITTDKAVFSVPHFPKGERTQNGGFVEAHHPETKKLLWRIQIYKINYDQALEKDVQDVFIKTLSFDKNHNLLIISDEKSRVFVLNLTTKKVTLIE